MLVRQNAGFRKMSGGGGEIRARTVGRLETPDDAVNATVTVRSDVTDDATAKSRGHSIGFGSFGGPGATGTLASEPIVLLGAACGPPPALAACARCVVTWRPILYKRKRTTA